MDTDLNELYIGLMDGTLYKVTSTDDQQIQTFDYNTTTNVLTIVLEDGGGTMTINLSKLDQDLNYTNSDPDDNTNSISITDGNTITIDDNHLGTDDQVLTGARTVNMNGNNLTFDGLQPVEITSTGRDRRWNKCASIGNHHFEQFSRRYSR